ncbi:MAG: single-stranded DNA-binding protein [Defluviitaleaceae bacterium]|nr:single-stranded DNA-binding protein [Defluviitaleaceae bacterium]
MNKVILMGRLTRDPELRYSNAAEPMAFARYTLAVDRGISREKKDAGAQSADFINCTCFGRNAEFVEKYFRKGQMVSVVGQLQVRSYDDQQGQRRWVTEVLTNEHHFAESRASFENRAGGGGYDQGHGGYNSQPPAQNSRPPQQQQSQQAQPPSDSFFEIDNTLDDDDLPF